MQANFKLENRLPINATFKLNVSGDVHELETRIDEVEEDVTYLKQYALVYEIIEGD